MRSNYLVGVTEETSNIWKCTEWNIAKLKCMCKKC